MSVTRRRLLSIGGAGVTGASAGCLSWFERGAGQLTVLTSHPEEQTLAVDIAPGYGAESTYAETFAVDQTRTPIEREDVVTGSSGDEFYVEVRQVTAGETFETFWKLSCVGDDVDDRLVIVVTEWGEVRFSTNRCSR